MLKWISPKSDNDESINCSANSNQLILINQRFSRENNGKHHKGTAVSQAALLQHHPFAGT